MGFVFYLIYLFVLSNFMVLLLIYDFYSFFVLFIISLYFGSSSFLFPSIPSFSFCFLSIALSFSLFIPIIYFFVPFLYLYFFILFLNSFSLFLSITLFLFVFFIIFYYFFFCFYYCFFIYQYIFTCQVTFFISFTVKNNNYKSYDPGLTVNLFTFIYKHCLRFFSCDGFNK